MQDSAPSTSTSRVLWIAIVFGLLVRIAVLASTATLGTGIVDEQHYRAIATTIYEHREFGPTAGQPTSIRPPLYPALIAGTWELASPQNLQAVRIVQILLAGATAWLIYLLGARVFDRRTGVYAALVCWLYPSLVFFNFLILTETTFTFLLIAFVWLTVRLLQEPRGGVAVATGVALGLAALTRSVLWPVPLILCPALLVLLRVPLRRRAVYSALMLAGYLVVITPWTVRNTRLQETLTIVDTMSGINLRMGNYEYTPDDRMWDAVSVSGPRSWAIGFGVAPGVNPTEGRKDKWAQAKAIEYMRAHPGQTLHRSLIKFADFWGLEREFVAGVQTGLFHPPLWFSVVASIAIVVAYAAIVALGAAGIWLAAPADWRLHAVLLFPIVLTMVAHTIVFGHSRYHVPLMPLLGLYAAHLCLVWQPWRFTVRRPTFVAAAMTVGVLLAIWIRQVAVTDAGRLASLLQQVVG